MVTGFPPNREDESQTDRQPIRPGGGLIIKKYIKKFRH